MDTAGSLTGPPGQPRWPCGRTSRPEIAAGSEPRVQLERGCDGTASTHRAAWKVWVGQPFWKGRHASWLCAASRAEPQGLQMCEP
jgi:hypothetical protein